MTDNYVQQRIKQIYDEYERNGRTKDYKITLTPINGSGDIHVSLIKQTKIKSRVTREKIIQKGDDLSFIQNEH